MPLDPNIILAGKTPQLPDATQMMQLSNMSLQNRAARGQLSAAEKSAKDQATLADLYKQNLKPDGTIDDAAMTSGLASAGLGSAIPEYQKGATAQREAQAKAQSAELAAKQEKLKIVNGTLASLLTQPNVTHEQVIAQISALVDRQIIDQQQGAQMVKSLPGPNMLRQFLVSKAGETMDAAKQLEMTMQKFQSIDTGGQVQVGSTNPMTGEFTANQTLDKTATPGELITDKRVREVGAGAGFSADEGSLMAALAERGVSLPAGLRSRAQMKATFASLISRNPDMTPDEIAEKVATGQININAERKETMTAAAQAGKVAVAVNELKTFGDQARDASAEVPRGRFVPLTQLMQMADASISDPALIRLKTKMQALNSAYDQLSARGGTDMNKRAHIAELFNTANSHEGVLALIKALQEEGVGAEEAARAATKRRAPEKSEPKGPGTGSEVPDDIAAILDRHPGG